MNKCYDCQHVEMCGWRKSMDSVPVAHAHWIKGAFADITCSNCGFPIVLPNSLIPKFAYCPHCGAKMERGENNEH